MSANKRTLEEDENFERVQKNEDTIQVHQASTKKAKLSEVKDKSPPQSEPHGIKLNAHFSSFMLLRSAIDKYQRENHVQLIVKDSKLLSSESTKRVIPKVYHLVNQKLMYHSITYTCKCHGELKQKPGSRVKNIGAKRLSCPMYMRFKLSTDLQSLVLFDLLETHNHTTDFNTFQLSPRQQIYKLMAIKSGKPDPDIIKQKSTDSKSKKAAEDVQSLIATAIKDVNSISSLGQLDSDFEPSENSAHKSCYKEQRNSTKGGSSVNDIKTEISSENNEEEENDDVDEEGNILYKDNPYSPLDPESSCSDSDEEEFRKHRDILPFPIRLIGSAVQSSPELVSLTKELITTQLEALNAKKRKILLENKMLELTNAKLALELKQLEKNHSDEATTFYLQS